MGGHGSVKPLRFKTWQDVPDDWVKTWSKRDPNNRIYETRRWLDLKKKQIWYGQFSHDEVYKLTKGKRIVYYSLWVGAFASLAYNIWAFNKYTSKK